MVNNIPDSLPRIIETEDGRYRIQYWNSISEKVRTSQITWSSKELAQKVIDHIILAPSFNYDIL